MLPPPVLWPVFATIVSVLCRIRYLVDAHPLMLELGPLNKSQLFPDLRKLVFTPRCNVNLTTITIIGSNSENNNNSSNNNNINLEIINSSSSTRIKDYSTREPNPLTFPFEVSMLPDPRLSSDNRGGTAR